MHVMYIKLGHSNIKLLLIDEERITEQTMKGGNSTQTPVPFSIKVT